MAARRPRRLLILGGFFVVALLASTGPVWGSYLGRQLPWFLLERVEIAGTDLLAPHEVLAASSIKEGEHLLDDREHWEEALVAHPMIADARITRKAPNALRIRIREERPVALVQDEMLRLASADGEILPLDPAGLEIDLPIVHGRLTDSTDAPAIRDLLAETDRLTQIAPTVMSEVSEIRGAKADEDVLVLHHAQGEIILPFGTSARRMTELTAVLADLQRQQTPTVGAQPVPAGVQLDLRFGDQIVVRPPSIRELL